MLEGFSRIALNIIDDMKKLSGSLELGSEYLLLAMYNIEDSLCHFLFNEYNVVKNEIEEELEKIEILRYDDKEYTDSLVNIFKYAKRISGSNPVSDEHLFMAILYVKDSIAYNLLIRLGFDIEELIDDVNEIYEFNSNKEIDLPYLYNMTANAGGSYVGIDDYIEQIMIILKRKNKNNPILVGNAGVGKTAIVEGLASYIVKNNIDMSIVSLNVGGMLAGTKYRGDFEERLSKTINEIIKRKNVIVFIDEIHTIVGSGSSESALDIANMLKPYLARNDFKVIGATTVMEYNKYFLTDKALQRRFEKVFVCEPSYENTRCILYGIKKDYELFHNVSISKKVLDYLLLRSDSTFINKKRPDKCIDVLDFMMSYLELKGKKIASISDVDECINKILGYKKSDDNIYNKCLLKYYFMYENDLTDKIILKLRYDGNKEGYNILIDDLKKLFGINEEMILELNLENYKESFMITSLVGAPPGYVGYNDEGLVTKHLKSYPISVIVLNNTLSGAYNVLELFNDMATKGFIYDKLGNYISTKNTILIYKDITNNYSIGFNSKLQDEISFDEVISYNIAPKINNDKYINLLRKYNIEASILYEVNDTNKLETIDTIYNLVKNKKKNKVTLYEENGKIKYN
ncbi:MAG: AAA family ATPase [Anaeroplasmataceae bacterium]